MDVVEHGKPLWYGSSESFLLLSQQSWLCRPRGSKKAMVGYFGKLRLLGETHQWHCRLFTGWDGTAAVPRSVLLVPENPSFPTRILADCAELGCLCFLVQKLIYFTKRVFSTVWFLGCFCYGRCSSTSFVSSVVGELPRCNRELQSHILDRGQFSQSAIRGHVFLHGLILWLCIFSLQAKEAGADDILDISKCELSEVRPVQQPVLTHRSDSSVCCLLPTVRSRITSVSLETEMALLPPPLCLSTFSYVCSALAFRWGLFPPLFFVGDCLSYVILQQHFCPENPFLFDKMGRADWSHILHQYLGRPLVWALMA